MVSRAHALARDELVRAVTAYEGITTADGAVDGSTLVDSNLIGRNDFISNKTVLIVSGDARDEDRGATAFNNVTGTITVPSPGFSSQIKAGTIYRILNISTVEIDVATINSKVGTSTDAAGTSTIFAWLAKLFLQGGTGLVYYGKVTTVVDTTHFKVAGLAGLGDAYFANTYRVYVVRDAAGGGAAPQGEMQPCSGYTSADGTFTHTAFSVGLAVNDEVLLLHARVGEIKDLIDRLGAFTTTENLKAILGDLATTKRLGQILGALTETDTLKAILGAFTATQNLKAILGDLTTTKNLGGILGGLTTTDNLKAILGAYTAAAPLKAAIDAILAEVAQATGTFSFNETLATEQTMVTVTIAARARVGAIWIDMVNVTQNTTIRLYEKIDGTNLREIKGRSVAWVTTDPDGVLIEGFAAYRDIRITLQCGGGGVASVNVPYAVV